MTKQIIAKLREAEARLSQGMKIAHICKNLSITGDTHIIDEGKKEDKKLNMNTNLTRFLSHSFV